MPWLLCLTAETGHQSTAIVPIEQLLPLNRFLTNPRKNTQKTREHDSLFGISELSNRALKLAFLYNMHSNWSFCIRYLIDCIDECIYCIQLLCGLLHELCSLSRRMCHGTGIPQANGEQTLDWILDALRSKIGCTVVQ